MTFIIIDRRYCGPPNSGNGGYICGRLAQYIAGSAEITLRAPAPLDKKLAVIAKDDGSLEIRDDKAVIASGRAACLELTRLPTATFQDACTAGLAEPFKSHEHPLPTCFVCGPERMEGDGLRIFAKPLVRQPLDAPVTLAATWIPDQTLAARDGFVAPEFLWSALDCPTGYAISYDRMTGKFDRTPILLGQMSARIEARPHPGERCVITAWEVQRNGRKRIAEAAAYGEAGALLAVARTTWIAVDRQVQLGRTRPMRA